MSDIFTPDERQRYARHILLREIGGAGQQRLKKARVTLVGAGGLGAPAALYLAGAGVGHLRLIDDDRVSLSNLQRQILFATRDVDRAKVVAGAEALQRLNPHVTVEAVAHRLTADNAESLFGGADVVLDGSDGFDTRFAVNAACLSLNVPLVSGAVGRWEGQVGVFRGRPCYRCFVPEAPPEAEPCALAGVVGALTGVIGAAMALEAVKLIAGAGEPLEGRLFLFDGLGFTARTVRLPPDPDCPACGALHDR